MADWIRSVDVIFKQGVVGVSVIVSIGITALFFRLQYLVGCIHDIREDMKKMQANHNGLDARLDIDEREYVLAGVCDKNHIELKARLDRERQDRIDRHKEIMEELRLIKDKVLDLKKSGNGKG